MTPELVTVIVASAAAVGILALCGMRWILYGHPFPSYKRRMTVLFREARDRAIKENNEDAVKIADAFIAVLKYKN